MAVRSDVPSMRFGYSTRGMFRVVSIATLAALVLRFETDAIGGQVVFGIDNRPSAPTSIDPSGFGNGAEEYLKRMRGIEAALLDLWALDRPNAYAPVRRIGAGSTPAPPNQAWPIAPSR